MCCAEQLALCFRLKLCEGRDRSVLSHASSMRQRAIEGMGLRGVGPKDRRQVSLVYLGVLCTFWSQFGPQYPIRRT